jgi:hypothetical protein
VRIGVFRFAAFEAIILNKAMRLVVMASALPFRAGTVPFGTIADHWSIIVNLLAGTLLGAWFGAGWATRMESRALFRVISLLPVGIAIVLLLPHDTDRSGAPLIGGVARAAAGVACSAGFGLPKPDSCGSRRRCPAR